MAEIQYKSCISCGETFDNQLPGMTAPRWAMRQYCSISCGNKGRNRKQGNDNYELQPLGKVTVKIDIDSCLFKFLSGQHRSDCQLRQDEELFLHPENWRKRDYADFQITNDNGQTSTTRVILLAD